MYGNDRGNEINSRNSTGHMVDIPVNEDLNAFVDFRPSAIQDTPKKQDSPDFRTVFGFHITLN